MFHPRSLFAVAGVVLAAGLVAVVPPVEGSIASPAERARVEAELRGMGFEGWRSIARAGGGQEWQVDDARLADGRQFDLRLADHGGRVRELHRTPG